MEGKSPAAGVSARPTAWSGLAARAEWLAEQFFGSEELRRIRQSRWVLVLTVASLLGIVSDDMRVAGPFALYLLAISVPAAVLLGTLCALCFLQLPQGIKFKVGGSVKAMMVDNSMTLVVMTYAFERYTVISLLRMLSCNCAR